MRDYNFFESFQRRKDLHINVKSPVFLGLLVILLILMASGGLVVQNAMVQTKLTDVTESLNIIQLSPAYQEAIQLQDSITVLTEYDQYASIALARIESGSILNTGFLKNLSEVIPSTVSLRNASISSANAAFDFQVPNPKAAAELLRDLDHSGLFLQTVLVSLTSEESGSYAASVNCIIKAGEPE